MNETNRAIADDDARYHRLVDGEMSRDEYRQMLASLDVQPEGWRRCALAFLEAQALGGELRAAVDDTEKPAPATASASSYGNLWLLGLAVAASFLLAFGLGLWVRGGSTIAAPDAPNIAMPSQDAGGAATPEVVQQSPTVDDVRRVAAPARYGSVTLSINGETGDEEEFNLPVYDASVVGDDWFSEPVLPAELLTELKNAGQELRRHRQWVPIDVDGGHRILVPVEELEIVPVGGRYYQ